MITSFIDGRVRIRDNALRDASNMALVLAMVKAQDGVTEVTANPKTGSLLVLYDPEKIPRETLLEAAVTLEKQFETAAPRKSAAKVLSPLFSALCGGRRSRHISPLSPLAESTLMSGLFLLTAVTGFGNKRLHLALGALLASVAGIHLYDRRRCLKP